MKQILLSLFFVLSSGFAFAQDYFTLSLALVNPSGKVSSKSYFQAKLRNNTDSVTFFVDGGADGSRLRLRHSYLRGEYYENDGKQFLGVKQPFFYFEGKTSLIIPPKSVVVVKLPLFVVRDELFSVGLLPYDMNIIRRYQKIRIKLEQFRAVALELKILSKMDLYSNWVEIHSEDFLPLFSK